MPLYAYRCTQCGHRFEKIQSFSAKQEKACPKCGGALERPLTAPGLHFKGGGFYVNDYAARAARPPPKLRRPRSKIGDEIQGGSPLRAETARPAPLPQPAYNQLTVARAARSASNAEIMAQMPPADLNLLPPIPSPVPHADLAALEWEPLLALVAGFSASPVGRQCNSCSSTLHR